MRPENAMPLTQLMRGTFILVTVEEVSKGLLIVLLGLEGASTDGAGESPLRGRGRALADFPLSVSLLLQVGDIGVGSVGHGLFPCGYRPIIPPTTSLYRLRVPLRRLAQGLPKFSKITNNLLLIVFDKDFGYGRHTGANTACVFIVNKVNEFFWETVCPKPVSNFFIGLGK